MKDQHAASGVSVDGLAQRMEIDFPMSEVIDELDQFAEGAAESVEPPDHQRVVDGQLGQGVLETGALKLRAGDAMVGKNLLATGLGQGINLQGKILLIC